MNIQTIAIFLIILVIVIVAAGALTGANKDGTQSLGLGLGKRTTTTTPRPTTTTPIPTTTTPIPTTTTIPWTCTDTDGGRVYTVKGTVSGQTTQPFSFTDYCITGNNTLVEYYCRQTGQPAPMSEYYNCAINYTSCTDGACV